MGSHGEARLRQSGTNAMNTTILKILRVAALAVLVLAAPTAGRAQSRDDVRQALIAGDHGKAIALALEALRGDPANAEIRFLLARAYAYSGRRDEAETILDRLLVEHPADADLIVFKGRMLCWHGDLEGAEKAFERALEAQPRSADALAGLADVASWRGQYDASLIYARRALDLDANHAGALFRVGSVLLWQGDYGPARGYLARAVELEPLNTDFRRALDRAVPLFVRKAEVWLSGRDEHWSDGRSDYGDLDLAVLFGLFDDRAKFVARMGRSWRAGGNDDRLSLEAYPRLWKGAYGYFDLGLAPAARFLPTSSIHAEVYQALLKRYEVSLGFRRIGAALGNVSLAVASAAAYWGPWYPNVRIAWANANAGTSFTWMTGLRRYFAGASYAWAGLGRGTRSLETASVEEVLAGPAWFFEAGFDIYVFKDIKLRGYVSRREAIGGADSTAVSLTVGYRF
jgi:YaiO family outer membrane protein